MCQPSQTTLEASDFIESFPLSMGVSGLEQPSNQEAWHVSKLIHSIIGPYCITQFWPSSGLIALYWSKNETFHLHVCAIYLAASWCFGGSIEHRRQWTWKSPGDRSRNKMDYILIQKRFRNAVKTLKSLPEADCVSDHVPVMWKFQIKLKKVRKTKAIPKFQTDLQKSDEKLRGKIAIAVHNKYKTLNNISEVEELWSEMKNSLNKVIEKNIPKKGKKNVRNG
ncbi:craniofacial development protein 2 [Plakobranchus ocellatus]|uniref:Craniofacial development protein 2 n=1 Tax=Plakobranchus ocellatus TaxID=259542 RepID=A0AAV3ZM47_9GAST|nr:craniofacial development protein 2 [Plakobranchus ocellatus]